MRRNTTSRATMVESSLSPGYRLFYCEICKLSCVRLYGENIRCPAGHALAWDSQIDVEAPNRAAEGGKTNGEGSSS
jgi:hypothetical protein